MILTEGPGSPASPGLPWNPCGPYILTDERVSMLVYVGDTHYEPYISHVSTSSMTQMCQFHKGQFSPRN